mmetsp:Transcript_3272/g.6692  ORF Transcript_3272/g.6692 Transcript_3272/m.6692 type:complete len:347 (-) Transcript_3272:91-1131(-)|eukprot:CAMPEP_0181295722 /NCGR_PEP_ID=MMETSP1101-20121128/4302_1 /TAXON_ID=46948 /ORGANISM="Rhodomonas abbreviata, Strain Caron Lab Isolate" /LENGTH=346 /DNA_ID=CAMNT_0023400499 /DNA_START=112 /DNA_END=1152 /DNA_ORIENTATION=+
MAEVEASARAGEREESSEEKSPADKFCLDLHRKYVVNLQENTKSFEYAVTEYLRMSGIYWGLTTMHLLSAGEQMKNAEIVEWVMKCQHPSGGFGGSINHDPHMLYTLSAVQILAVLNRMDLLDKDKIAKYVAGLQKADGSFVGDAWGEVDTRFSYCALNCLSLLGRMDVIDVDAAVAFVVSTMNFDGGFGCVPGAESHGGQVFCCVGALAIANALHHVRADDLGWWLCERQCQGGGLNGRPEKLPDVCYSWWVLSSLVVLGRRDWVDRRALAAFILEAQDTAGGGIADRPGDEVDVFHTFFGVGGLSLLGYTEDEEGGIPGLKRIDPVFALPVETLERMGLPVCPL